MNGMTPGRCPESYKKSALRQVFSLSALAFPGTKSMQENASLNNFKMSSYYLTSTDVAGGINPDELDTFHEMILVDEISRCGAGGVVWAIMGGLGIGMPPVMFFGSQELKDRVIPPCVRGEKFICLCVSIC